MPSTSSSSSTEREAAVLGAPRHDRLRRHRADLRQRLELRLGRGVEVDQRTPRRRDRRLRQQPPRRRCRRATHHDLLTVDQHPRQVERRQVDAAPRPAGRLDGVDDPGADVEHHDPGSTHLAGHVDGHRGRRPVATGEPAPDASPARPARRRRVAPRPRTGQHPYAAGAGGASSRSGSPRTTHQPVTASPTATRTATTTSWVGPRATRPRTPPAAAAPPGAARRADRAAARRRRRTDRRERRVGTCPGVRHRPQRPDPGVSGQPRLVEGARVGGSSGRVAASSAVSRPAAGRRPPGGRHEVGERSCRDARQRRRSRTARRPRLWRSGSGALPVDDSRPALSCAAPRRPRSCPARRARRARRRARRTRPRVRRGWPRAAAPASR